MAFIRALSGNGGGGANNVKIMEETVTSGANTIETDVIIKQIIGIWTLENADSIAIVEWNDTRPSESWTFYNTNTSGAAKRAMPNSTSTALNSVSGTSFVVNVNSADISRFGNSARFYIYY